jgi:hypothetical protein
MAGTKQMRKDVVSIQQRGKLNSLTSNIPFSIWTKTTEDAKCSLYSANVEMTKK